MIYGHIIGLRTEITDEEIPGIEDNTKIPLNIQDVITTPVVVFDLEATSLSKYKVISNALILFSKIVLK